MNITDNALANGVITLEESIILQEWIDNNAIPDTTVEVPEHMEDLLMRFTIFEARGLLN